MRPCNKCLENNWSFEKVEDYIIATCNLCAHMVEFEAKKPNKELYHGDKCRACKGLLEERKSPIKRSKLNKPYYYTHTIVCTSCKRVYLQERFKVITGVDANAKLKQNMINGELST